MPRLRDVDRNDLSPYLEQHVNNPVEWWSWGDDALGEALRRDIPIFLSVGYAACHWCHVMSHESFDDPSLAALLNAHFIAIKVDREERPDLDQLYMAATQLISGHGGWPMSVFLLPNGRPFTAGTYYPPINRHGQVGFGTLLEAVETAWRTRRSEVEQQALSVQQALVREVAFVEHLVPRTTPLDLTAIRRQLADEIAGATDAEGGSSSPRFPRPSYVDSLLGFEDELTQAARQRILDAMSRRGLFDHLAGGFARYSVDAHWHVPHFEKMLSDQALLARTYFRAAREQRSPHPYEDVARRTVHFVQRELRVTEGYGASLDADAGGIEGSHITWNPEEVRSVLTNAGLSELTSALTQYLSITPRGDLEGRSVPRLAHDADFVPPSLLEPALTALREARQRRPQPTRDNKVILEWNAMFASALFASRDAQFTLDAMTILQSLESRHFARGHWWRTQSRRDYATAADMAWLVDTYVDAYEVRGEDSWLVKGYEAASYLIEHYWDGPVPRARAPHDGAGFFNTSDQCTDLFTRPKEIFDGATPSSHAVATRALARLALCRADQDLLCVPERLVALGAQLIATHPLAVVDLVEAATFVTGIEVVVPGEPNTLSDHVRSLPMLRGVLITGSGTSPLLEGRHQGLAYVCHQGWCERPVDNVDELAALLEEAS
ncbi:MAG: thioredoxin domain-containing protein [Acidimicrobiaceae bacterium]|nr:thioredoxin domain-containing protein [Acidimicrobiaceae bacterium]